MLIRAVVTMGLQEEFVLTQLCLVANVPAENGKFVKKSL